MRFAELMSMAATSKTGISTNFLNGAQIFKRPAAIVCKTFAGLPMSKNDYIKFWPIALSLLIFMGATAGFYFTTQTVAADVETIKRDYAKSNLVNLKFIIVENAVKNLNSKVDGNENRTVKQLDNIIDKLDELNRLMLKKVEITE